MECQGMSVNESIQLPILVYHTEFGTEMDASYLLPGVISRFSALPVDKVSLRRESENEIYDSIHRLDKLISIFTGKILTQDRDSLLIFQGISERYAPGDGPSLLLGIPA